MTASNEHAITLYKLRGIGLYETYCFNFNDVRYAWNIWNRFITGTKHD